MFFLRATLVVMALCFPGAHAGEADDPVVVTVADPYIELHSGPGRGYPIHHVAARGESVTILKSRTNWFKIITRRGKTGWVVRSQMQKTLDLQDRPIDLRKASLEDFIARSVEIGVLESDYDGAPALSAYIGYHLTQNIAAELRLAQATGNFSNSKIAILSVKHQPFPEWRFSPFFTLGAGVIKTEPNATLVRTRDRKDNSLLVGIGAYYYLSGRFMLRFEYNNHLILTSRNVNEEVNEWKAGISVFF